MVNNTHKKPLHDLAAINTLVAARAFELVNPRARRNYKELAWKTLHMQGLVAALNVDRHFRKTKCGMGSELGLLDVDCYVIPFNEDELREDREDGIEFWIELAMDPLDPTVAIVSFHLSGQP